MYSFYGGKQGAPFVIVKSFSSIEEMIKAFKQGYNYTEVGFDEYVLINTEDKNSPDNGALYRRGYNFSDLDTGGAVYVGTIVGPEGSPTMLALDLYKNVNEMINTQIAEGNTSIFTQGSFNLGEIDDEGNFIPGDLIPGMTIDENGEKNITDEILWASCCIRNHQDDDVNTVLGFKIPYTVFDFNIEIEEDSTKTAVAEKIEDIDETTGEIKIHPFYEQWKLKLPRGFRGGSVSNLRVITANDTVIYEDKNAQKEDIKYNRKIWVYDITTQIVTKDESENKIFSNEIKTYYAGPCKDIESMTLLKNGIIQTENAYKEIKEINAKNPIKFIDNINIDADSKLLTIEYNTKNDSVTFNSPLNSIEKMVINPADYHLLVYYSSSIVRNNEDLKKSDYDNGGWVDLGSVKSDSGILIGLDLPSESGNGYTIQEAINELNRLYPFGLGSIEEGYSLHGRVVTATDSENGNKNFFAYDYNKEQDGWYFLGNISSESASSNAKPVIIGNSTDSTIGNSLPEGGIWLVTTEI